VIGYLAAFALALGVAGWIGVAVVIAVAVKKVCRRVWPA
jgi:hypothetical protein